MSTRPRLPPSTIASIVERYKNGVSPVLLAQEYGVHRMTVISYVRRAGVPRSEQRGSPQTSPEKQLAIIKDFQDSGNARQTALKHGITDMTVYNIMTRHGIKWQGRSGKLRLGRPTFTPVAPEDRVVRAAPCNEEAFDVLGDPGAYWIGFLMADGCISDTTAGQKRLCVRVKGQDEGHLLLLRRFLQSSAGICQTHTTDQFGGEFPCSQFVQTSDKLCDSLISYGVVPRKTHKERALRGIDKLDSFWRGYIDGDGHVVPPPRSARLAIVFSLPLAEQFVAYLKEVGCPESPEIKEAPGCHMVYLNKEGALFLMKRLWAPDSVCLERKKRVIIKQLARYGLTL